MTSKPNHIATLGYFLILAVALAGSVVLFNSTARWGIGACQDSAVYLAGARNIMNGLGYRGYGHMDPIIQWPPFFPFSLAVLGKFGLDPLVGARYLHVALFGINIFLAGFILKKLTRSTPIALLGSYLMLTSTANIEIHSMAWSEPWFIFLAFLGFFLLSQYLGGRPKSFLIAASLLNALACLDRYAGVSVIASGTLMIGLLHQKNLLNRLKDGLIYIVLTTLPLGLWLFRNFLVDQKLVNRSLSFHLPPQKYFTEAVETLSSWVLYERFPPQWGHAALIFEVVMVTLISFLVFRKEIKDRTFKVFSADEGLRFVGCMAIFAVCNTGLELAHLMFMNLHANANDRHFILFFVAGLLSFLIIVHRLLRSAPKPRLLAGTTLVFLALLCVSTYVSSSNLLRIISRQGSDHTSRRWQKSPTLGLVRSLPQDAVIYANDPSIVYVITNHNAFRLPRKYGSRRHALTEQETQKNTKLAAKLKKIEKKLGKKDGYLVFLDKQLRWFKLSEADVEKHIPITLVERFSDGSIYKIGARHDLESPKTKSL
ncbi:MAG TPA: hypothetical protein VD913_05230 [bacterium]|nr:hypothetical protein [bacterium]